MSAERVTPEELATVLSCARRWEDPRHEADVIGAHGDLMRLGPALLGKLAREVERLTAERDEVTAERDAAEADCVQFARDLKALRGEVERASSVIASLREKVKRP